VPTALLPELAGLLLTFNPSKVVRVTPDRQRMVRRMALEHVLGARTAAMGASRANAKYIGLNE
jgi:hypothetical protein